MTLISDKTKVTVGLLCYQEKEKLSLTLQSLVEQTEFHRIGEVLLLQNGTCQQTLNCAKTFLSNLPLVILSHPVNHIGKGRAMIVNRATWPLIAWTDGDCVAPPNWLEKLLSHWESCKNLSPSGVGGPNRLPEKKLWQKLVNLSLSHPLGHGWSPQAWKPKYKVPVSHLPTTNALFSISKIKEVGNFSQKYHPTGEDLDLGIRLKTLSPLFLFPTPLIINDHSSSYFQNLKRLFRFGQMKQKNKDLLFIPALLFAPGFFLFLILGTFYSICWLFLTVYFLFLTGATLQVFKKDRTLLAFLLLFFWPVQHLAYSLGVLSGWIKHGISALTI